MNLKSERKRLLASFAVLAALSVATLVVWSIFQERARAAKVESEILKGLSEEQVVEVLQSEAAADSLSVREIAESSAKRKTFLEGLRQHLSLAAKARREGYAETEEHRVNFEYKKDILLADLYRARLSAGKSRLYVVPEEEMNAVWEDQVNEDRFTKTMDVLHRLREKAAEARESDVPVSRLKGETLRKARDNFARTAVLSGMATRDPGFMSQAVVPLRIRILEAGLLANAYLTANYRSFLPTRSEIESYLAAHPEYDPTRKLEKAREVLARVQAGGDFSELAREFSEDARSSHRGGLYEDVGRGVLWPEIEDRVFSMKEGEVAGGLIETQLGYHILKLIKRPSESKGKLTYSVRHIVIQKNFEEPGEELPGMPRPFMTPAEIAKAQIENEKREAFIAEVMSASPVSLPDDFTLEIAGRDPAAGDGAETKSNDR